MTSRPAFAVVLGSSIVVALAGCASALRPPEPLPTSVTTEVTAFDRSADDLWEARTAASVREAATAYEGQIARQVDPFRSTVGAARSRSPT